MGVLVALVVIAFLWCMWSRYPETFDSMAWAQKQHALEWQAQLNEWRAERREAREKWKQDQAFHLGECERQKAADRRDYDPFMDTIRGEFRSQILAGPRCPWCHGLHSGPLGVALSLNQGDGRSSPVGNEPRRRTLKSGDT